MSVNKVILLGYVGSDPEIRYPEKDRAIAYVSLATNDRFANSQTEITEWHSLIMGGQNAQFAEKYIRSSVAKENPPLCIFLTLTCCQG